MCQNCHCHKKCRKTVKQEPIVGNWTIATSTPNPFGEPLTDNGHVAILADGNYTGDSVATLQIKTPMNPYGIPETGDRWTSFVGQWKRVPCTRRYKFQDVTETVRTDLCATGLCGENIVPSGAGDPRIRFIGQFEVELSEDGNTFTPVGQGNVTVFLLSDEDFTTPLVSFNFDVLPGKRIKMPAF